MHQIKLSYSAGKGPTRSGREKYWGHLNSNCPQPMSDRSSRRRIGRIWNVTIHLNSEGAAAWDGVAHGELSPSTWLSTLGAKS